MKELLVSVLIGDPWEFGEAIGWPDLIGLLRIGGPEGNSLTLNKLIVYEGHSYQAFDVSARHEGHRIDEVFREKVACSLSSKGVDPILNFTGSLSRA